MRRINRYMKIAMVLTLATIFMAAAGHAALSPQTPEYVEIQFQIGLQGGVKFFTLSKDHDQLLKNQKFDSKTAAINYLSQNGWVVDQIYTPKTAKSRMLDGPAWLFRKD